MFFMFSSREACLKILIYALAFISHQKLGNFKDIFKTLLSIPHNENQGLNKKI